MSLTWVLSILKSGFLIGSFGGALSMTGTGRVATVVVGGVLTSCAKPCPQRIAARIGTICDIFMGRLDGFLPGGRGVRRAALGRLRWPLAPPRRQAAWTCATASPTIWSVWRHRCGRCRPPSNGTSKFQSTGVDNASHVINLIPTSKLCAMQRIESNFVRKFHSGVYHPPCPELDVRGLTRENYALPLPEVLFCLVFEAFFWLGPNSRMTTSTSLPVKTCSEISPASRMDLSMS